ncbi:hypothetical protein GGF46_003637 [Coemansia sp. RSA 552]|nr:hypothetical protein GGF46_003637 [Coemansia sp. RSA 552]
MASNPELPVADEAPDAAATASDSGAEVNRFISSLHLERHDTQLGRQQFVRRRRTLMKQAKDPQADQKALDQEIRHVERLASLLGRRHTRFNRKGAEAKVNHDLDSTLDGFFDVHDDSDRVGDILLSAGHRADDITADYDDLEGDLDDPELRETNISSAPAGLISQGQQRHVYGYQHVDDPFEKIEELNVAEPPSGSAEYLPLDTYQSDEISIADKPGDGALPASRRSQSHPEAIGGPAYGGDDGNDDDELLGMNRNNTWNRQSTALIMEREQYGPALPAIMDDDGEDEQEEEEVKTEEQTVDKPRSPVAHAVGPDGGDVNTASAAPSIRAQIDNAASPRILPQGKAKVVADALDSLAHAGKGAAAPESDSAEGSEALDDASAAQHLSEIQTTLASSAPRTPADQPTASAVEDYLDILDFMDTTGLADEEFHRSTDKDDGHISSDLQGNGNDSSSSDDDSASDIDLSGADSSASESNSDSQYLARLAPACRYSLANVAEEQQDQQDEREESDGSVPASHVDSASAQVPESAAVATAGVLNGRSLLRRNRRIFSRRDTGNGRQGIFGRKASTLQAKQSTEDSGRTSMGINRSLARALHSRLSLGSTGERPVSDDDNTTGARKLSDAEPDRPVLSRPVERGSVDDTQQTAGLAKLASEALIAAVEQQRKARGKRIQPLPSSSARHKPLPPIPDRISRTMEAADAKAAAARSLPPPLPAKERPKIPRALGEDGLGTRTDLAAALERPSSMRLFGSNTVQHSPAQIPALGSPGALPRPATAQSPPATQQHEPALSLREWLQRTDMLLPANNPVAKPRPYPPGASAKSVTFVSYHYEAGSPGMAPFAAYAGPSQPPSGNYPSDSAMTGPTVFSAPPGADDGPDPEFGSGMVEPSAPMLVEPSAPDFPQNWPDSSAHGFAFPAPMHYAPAGPEPLSPHQVMGFAMPMSPSQQQYPPQQGYGAPFPYPQPGHGPQAPPLSPMAQHGYDRPQAPPAIPEKPRPYQPALPEKPRPYQPGFQEKEPSPPAMSLSPSADYVMVEDEEKAQLSAIYNEYKDGTSSAAPSREDSALPSRTSSLSVKPTAATVPEGPASLSVDTDVKQPLDESPSAPADMQDSSTQLPEYDQKEGMSSVALAARDILEKDRQRESKRKSALLELVATEKTYTDDLRMVVELFLLPIQLLGNRKIVDVIFGDMVKITEMNGKMYFDMITHLGPLACFVDSKRAGRNRRKKKTALKPAASGNHRSVLHGSSIRSPTTPVNVSVSASATMSRRRSAANNQTHSSPRASVYSYDVSSVHDAQSLNRAGSRNDDHRLLISNGDEASIRTSNSGGSAGAERHGSVRSMKSSPEEYDSDDASKWTENQVLDYFKNVCIGDVMANYLKDFSEHYALYSANHDKAIEYLKLVRESSSRLNLRNDATRDAHQKLLLTLQQAEKDDRVRRLRLESFLLAPVQRVMRYPLLLEALLKHTPEDHPDHDDVALALSIATSVATEVDRKSDELMNRHRLAELQSTFDWAHLLGGVQLKLDTFTKLVGQRKFVRKGPLRKASSGKHLYAILFNDFMMLTVSDRRGGVWCYEPYRLPIQTYDLLAREPTKDQFELVNLKNSEVLQLRADTAAEAADWVKDIMKTANYCYEVMCEALRSGIQVSKVKSVISPEAREKILLGSKPMALAKRH